MIDFLVSSAREWWQGMESTLQVLRSPARLGSLVRLRTIVRRFARLLEELNQQPGGLLIPTPSETDAVQIWTRVTKFGDLATWVRPEAMGEPELLERHWRRVDETLEPIRDLAKLEQVLSALLTSLAPLIFVVYASVATLSGAEVRTLILTAIAGAVGSFVLPLVRRWLLRALGPKIMGAVVSRLQQDPASQEAT